MPLHTVAVDNRYTGDRVVDKLMNDVEDRRLHLCGLQVLVRAQLEVLQRLSKELGIGDVDCNEFQDAVLSDYADDHSSLGLVVDINQWNPACFRVEHGATCFVQRLTGMYRNGLQWLNTDGFLDFLPLD